MNPLSPQFQEANGRLLQEDEPAPCTLRMGTSPVIIISPHNGYAVPRLLHTGDPQLPLGMPKFWFDPTHPEKRHEACDWGLQKLLNALEQTPAGQSCTLLTANHSRLVCDLNRISTESIPLLSSEHEQPIFGNENLSDAHRKSRIREIYLPYMKALVSAITQTKKRHGHAVVLDLHSFTPTWKGKARDVDMGTITFNDHPVNHTLLEILPGICQQADIHFAPEQPYTLREPPFNTTGAASIISEYGVYYMGIEMKNSLLQNPEFSPKFLSIVTHMINHLQNHPQRDLFTAPTAENFSLDSIAA